MRFYDHKYDTGMNMNSTRIQSYSHFVHDFPPYSYFEQDFTIFPKNRTFFSRFLLKIILLFSRFLLKIIGRYLVLF